MTRRLCLVVALLLALAAIFLGGWSLRVVTAGEPPAEYCPAGMDQVPNWSMGICGDEALIDMATCQPVGEVENPGPDSRQARIKILSVYGRHHCLENPIFWPLTSGVTETFEITMDVVVNLEFPQGRWGLGGYGACHAPYEIFLPLVQNQY